MAGYLGAIPVPQATQNRESFTCSANQTSFATAGYTVGFVDAFLNGVRLNTADFTATNGSDIVLASGAAENDVLDVISYATFEVNAQTFTGTTTLTDVVAASLDISGNIDIDGITNLDVVDIDGAVNMATTLLVTGNVDFNGDLDVDGTTNLDVVDIDGAVDMASTLAVAGNVGIGTTSIDVSTQAGGSGYKALQIESDEGGQLNFDHNDAGTGSTIGQINFQRAGEVVAEIEGVTDGATDNGRIAFRTQPNGGALTERVRIDHDGNLLVGTTDTSLYNNTSGGGLAYRPNSELTVAAETSPQFIVNNTGSDGEMVRFAKDGSTVGSIACRSSGGNLQIDTSQSGIDFGGDGYLPMRNGAITDNSLDIGSSSFRYQDIYLAGTANLTNSSSITGKTSGASSFNIASGHTGSGIGLYIGQFGVSANLGIGIDANRIVTMPAQPAFQVRKSGNQENLAANDSAITITFDTEVFDGNSDFTGNTFTAPVTGKYMLSINTYLGSVDTAASYILVGINTSNRNYYRIIAPKFSSDLNYYGMNFSVVADMDAGDTAISIYQQNGGAAQVDIIASNGTQFSGYLLG